MQKKKEKKSLKEWGLIDPLATEKVKYGPKGRRLMIEQ
jgi:hypothetical protein